MIYLITATPGSGKTLWSVREIFARVNEAEPWNIFSNIEGLKLDTAQPLKESFQDYPPRSLVVIDESQKIRHFSKKYKHPKANEFHPEVEFLQTHRHADHLDIIFITQAARLLNPDVLDMVGMHYHLHRPMGMKMATWWLWRYSAANPNTKSAKLEAEDSGTFTYPKNLFDMYKSSDGGGDTHGKIKIPMKIVNAVWMLLLVLGVTAYLYASSRPETKAEKPDEPKNTIEKTIPDSANAAHTKTSTQPASQDLDNFCRKGENVEKAECVEWFNNLSSTGASVTPVQVVYNPNKPYEYEYQPTQQPLDFPRMSGVIRLKNGRLMAVDQQGNYMPKVSQYDCRQYLDGYRPFDYFRKEKPPEPMPEKPTEEQLLQAKIQQLQLQQLQQSQRSAGEQPQLNPETTSL